VVNTGSLFEWDDLSGNGNNAKSIFGNAPTRQDNQINGKTVLRFNNGALVRLQDMRIGQIMEVLSLEAGAGG